MMSINNRKCGVSLQERHNDRLRGRHRVTNTRMAHNLSLQVQCHNNRVAIDDMQRQVQSHSSGVIGGVISRVIRGERRGCDRDVSTPSLMSMPGHNGSLPFCVSQRILSIIRSAHSLLSVLCDLLYSHHVVATYNIQWP